ncbi:unnamed protein product [Rotaria sp. Silwood1]|nr:unnamed protein product [Rotaria sp. Silwood1]CAF4652586.1 unnamed protein product [Rotaria sp. Silwood1]
MDIDVGTIDRIKIWHDNTGIGSAWLLDSITIRKKHSTCRPITNIYIQRLEKISEILYRQSYEQLKKDYNLRLPSTKDNEERSIDRRYSKSTELDDLVNNRSILRSPITYDKTNLQKKVRWDEQSIGSQDEPLIIDTQQMKNKQKIKRDSSSERIETGHFEHQAYWISSHNYINNTWKINSIEELNKFDFDEKTRLLLLSDRLAINTKIKTSINEKDDDIYEFEAKCWLSNEKGKKLEIYLNPKSIKLSTIETKSKLLDQKKTDIEKQNIISTKKSSSSYQYDKSNDENLKHSLKFDLGPLEKSPRSQTSLDRSVRDTSKIKFDDSYSSQPNDHSSSTYQRSISPHTNKNLKISSTNEQNLLTKPSYESTYHSRLTPTSLIDTRSSPSSLSNQYSKTSRFNKEPMSPLMSNRDLSEKISTESSTKPKSVTRSPIETSSHKITRSQVYGSAYGTIPMDDF